VSAGSWVVFLHPLDLKACVYSCLIAKAVVSQLDQRLGSELLKPEVLAADVREHSERASNAPWRERPLEV
jgi:hypothetical protein